MHIANAFTFELSKVERLAIRQRMVSHLRRVDEELVETVAEGLGIEELPEPAGPARPVIETEPSPALSILKNAPEGFAGRKLGVLLTDGIEATQFKSLKEASRDAEVMVEIVAEKVGGVMAADGRRIEADQKFDGAPSVIYDAVAIIAAEDGAKKLAGMHGAKTFLADAHAHMKFIARSNAAREHFWPVAVPAEPDAGVHLLDGADTAERFLKTCGKLRFRERAG